MFGSEQEAVYIQHGRPSVISHPGRGLPSLKMAQNFLLLGRLVMAVSLLPIILEDQGSYR